MEKFDSNVVFPPQEKGQSIQQLRERVFRDTNNFSAAYTLYRQQMNRGYSTTRLPPSDILP